MAATFTTAGTWSSIPGLTGMDGKINTPSIDGIDLEELKTIHGLVSPEVRDIVQMVADGYGILHWQGAALLWTLLKAYMNSEGPTQQNRYTP